MPLTFAQDTDAALPLYLVAPDGLDAVKARLTPSQATWVEANGFTANIGEICILPDALGLSGALAGLGTKPARQRTRFALAAVRAKLPDAIFRLETDLDGEALTEQALGWLLSGYVFDKYAPTAAPKAQLVTPAGVDRTKVEIVAAGEALTRNLINTPASDMGPDELEAAARDLADCFGAAVTVVAGEDLLSHNLPMIHAVGRASPRAPRLIELNWGNSGPKLTLVGKGVCFDTGGLNIKPGASMGLMKKDMGGAATVLGLSHMIMALGLKVQLRVLIPAVENAISGNSFRPQDILVSRKGLTVEINNTDAEGRLVLADALALADEENPDLIVSMATLTGAARVAVGPDLAPFYATSPRDAAAIVNGAEKAADPVWQMPFWDPYETMIEPGIADLDNAPSGGFAGSITAALFLRRFVTQTPRYVHFDIYGWNPSAAPARPKGGIGQGHRALLEALSDLFAL
ncbi:leucyl aminopeptidase family protein [Celeribacter marinus]|uniref:leucyl aminopeptidase family protein n=1 Tax=Celeribacter marinus TaxID=1397108 RepID=UPI00317F3D29